MISDRNGFLFHYILFSLFFWPNITNRHDLFAQQLTSHTHTSIVTIDHSLEFINIRKDVTNENKHKSNGDTILMRLDSCVRGWLLIGHTWCVESEVDQNDGYVLFTVQTYQIRACVHWMPNTTTIIIIIRNRKLNVILHRHTVIKTNCHRI